MSTRRIVIINFAVFALGWLLVFRLGADREPPSGFWLLFGLLVAADVIQCLYLRYYYLQNPGLLSALVFFASGMLLAGLLLSQFHLHPLMAIACVMAGMAYGLFFYGLKRLLCKKK